MLTFFFYLCSCLRYFLTVVHVLHKRKWYFNSLFYWQQKQKHNFTISTIKLMLSMYIYE